MVLNMTDKYQNIAEFLQPLASAKRIQVIFLLAEREMTVTDLVKKMQIRKANVSQCLAILRYNQMVTFRKEGKNAYYRLANSKAANFVKAIQKI
jgi:ArsR family transcriptional regulator